MFIPMNTLNIPKNPTKKWEWIKYRLRDIGWSLAALARELGVSRNAMNNVKRVPYPRMERAIAAKLGMEPLRIWPERWNADGSPKRQRPKKAESRVVNPGQSNARRTSAHRQASEGL